jgi:hypothetical protein
MPNFSGAFRKTAFAQTAADFASVACALERYRIAHGTFPDSLEQLTAPGNSAAPIVGKLPSDIMDGQPLHYRRTPNGSYLLYSAGWNQKDDGGAIPTRKWEFDIPLSGDWVWRPL